MEKLDILKIVITTSGLLWAGLKGIPATIRFGNRLLDGMETIKSVEEQFKNNGGSSLKDSVDRVESLLIIERERNRAASTLLPAGMFETDAQGLMTWVSSRYTEITGAALANAEGMNWVTLIHDDDRSRVVKDWQHTVDNERRSVINYRLSTDKDTHHVLVETFPIHNGNKFLGHIGLMVLI